MSAPYTARQVAIQCEILRRSFADFAAWAWPLVTGSPLVWNDATAGLVRALQDVADGKVTRLLVAMPPGVGKSTVLAAYAAWRLARSSAHRTIHASHAFELAATASRRVRRLVEGDAYRAMFASVRLREDESTVAHWATTDDGRYIATGTDGALTGRRAHEAVLDDPLNAIDRFSKAARDTLWAWFCESLSTRLDGDRAPIVVVQQRLDVDDLIGRLVESGGWTLLELPAERDDGTLLAPNVLPREKLDQLRAQIGSSTYACQYLQRPSDDSSAIIRRTWWRFYRPGPQVAANAQRPAGCDLGSPSADAPDRIERVTIAADLTFGSTTGDYAVVQAWGARGGARYLLGQVRRRMGFEESVQVIRDMANQYRGARIVVEKAANGAAVIETLARAVPGVIAVKPLGSKAQRLSAIAPVVEAGQCYLPLGWPGLGDFVEELAGASKHDDIADAAAYALADLARVTHAPAPSFTPRLYTSEHAPVVSSSGGFRHDDDNDEAPLGIATYATWERR